MKNILVPIGSSEKVVNILQYAIDFAHAIEANVFVFRAYISKSKAGTIINIDDFLEKETNLYMRSIINSVDRKGKEVQLISAKGSVLSSIESVNKELGIDLIIMGPKSNSIIEEEFLGSTAGKIIKQSNIPALIVPEDAVFKPYKSILTAFRTGVVSKEEVLNPLKHIKSKFGSTTNLLLVKTPHYIEEDLVLDKALENLQDSLTITENATTFQGVLEHFQSHNPEMLCVFRRKRGFFTKLLEKPTILKKDFHCNIPLLVLRGKMD